MLHWIDWSIVSVLLLFLCVIVLIFSRITNSVADFLSASRCAGRYLLSVAHGMAGVGAITMVAAWEMYYEAGFTAQWWNKMMILVTLVISLTGYVRYRFRQTRALTMAQVFEIRYSKSFRIFAGIVAFLCGIINYGLFPSIASRFIVYFGGFPQKVLISGLEVPTFAIVMFILLTIAVFFTWKGGQITVIITDFLQGAFSNVFYVAILIFIFIKIDFSQLSQVLLSAPENQSLVNPFKGGGLKDFNVTYFLIAAFGAFYSFMAWQGSSGYNSSAKSAHEAKMAGIMSMWRGLTSMLVIVMMPIVAYLIMHHESFSDTAFKVKAMLSNIDNPKVQGQMIIPYVMSEFLPVGLKGALLAVMVFAAITTDNTALHSWGSILIQDVIMPFRKKPFTTKQHLILLRLSVLFIAVYAFLFSLLYQQTQSIYMYFALTGSIFLSGAGSCIIGGLYWKKGTNLGAFGAMITGVTLSITTFILQHFWDDWYGKSFPINSQKMFFFSMVASLSVYVILSLIQNKSFNMDRMLHRGKYAVEKDIVAEQKDENKQGRLRWFLEKMGMNSEFTKFDRVIFYATTGWSVSWFLIFLVGNIWHLILGTTDEGWVIFWKYWSFAMFILGTLVTIWFLIGGFADLKDMLARLKIVKRDEKDDGMVINHHNLDEE